MVLEPARGTGREASVVLLVRVVRKVVVLGQTVVAFEEAFRVGRVVVAGIVGLDIVRVAVHRRVAVVDLAVDGLIADYIAGVGLVAVVDRTSEVTALVVACFAGAVLVGREFRIAGDMVAAVGCTVVAAVEGTGLEPGSLLVGYTFRVAVVVAAGGTFGRVVAERIT